MEKVLAMLAGADVQPGDMVLLPEMFDSGFSLRVEVTEDEQGQSRAFLANLARRYGCWVQGGVTLRGPDISGRNHAAIFDPSGRPAATYDKIHPFSYGRESERFVGGEQITTWRWSAGDASLVVCPAICYDLRFPELFRAGLVQGAEAFAIGANWPEPRQAHWRALCIARAIENQAFVFAVNRTGNDPHLSYVGGSLAIDPRGTVLDELGAREEVRSVFVDPAVLNAWRREFPAWKDHRLVPPRPAISR